MELKLRFIKDILYDRIVTVVVVIFEVLVVVTVEAVV